MYHDVPAHVVTHAIPMLFPGRLHSDCRVHSGLGAWNGRALTVRFGAISLTLQMCTSDSNIQNGDLSLRKFAHGQIAAAGRLGAVFVDEMFETPGSRTPKKLG